MNHIEIISITQEDGFYIAYAWLDSKTLPILRLCLCCESIHIDEGGLTS